MVDGNAEMGDIDYFLRCIWLECCGHMSSLTISGNKQRGMMWDIFEAQELLMKGKTAAYEKMMEEANDEIPKSRKTKAVLG